MDALFALPYGPFVIFAMRVVDVSLGSIRLIVMVRGQRLLAAAIGFVEVLIWILAVGSALQHLGSPYHVVGYAAGFASGTYIGVSVGHYLAFGAVVVRAIVPDSKEGEVARMLREHGYGVTEVDGRGRSGAVDILNVVVERQSAPEVVERIEGQAPRAFITVEEIRTTYRGMLRPLSLPQPRLVRK